MKNVKMNTKKTDMKENELIKYLIVAILLVGFGCKGNVRPTEVVIEPTNTQVANPRTPDHNSEKLTTLKQTGDPKEDEKRYAEKYLDYELPIGEIDTPFKVSTQIKGQVLKMVKSVCGSPLEECNFYNFDLSEAMKYERLVVGKKICLENCEGSERLKELYKLAKKFEPTAAEHEMPHIGGPVRLDIKDDEMIKSGAVFDNLVNDPKFVCGLTEERISVEEKRVVYGRRKLLECLMSDEMPLDMMPLFITTLQENLRINKSRIEQGLPVLN